MDYKDHIIDKFHANENNIKGLKLKLKGVSDPEDIKILDELIDEGLKKRKVLIDKMNVFKSQWWE